MKKWVFNKNKKSIIFVRVRMCSVCVHVQKVTIVKESDSFYFENGKGENNIFLFPFVAFIK